MNETQKALKDSIDANRIGFMLTEIDLGLTFVKVGFTTNRADTKERNRANAQEAHDSAVHLLAQDRCMSQSQRDETEVSLKNLQHQINSMA